MKRTLRQKHNLRRRSLYRRAMRKAPLVAEEVVRRAIAARPSYYGTHSVADDIHDPHEGYAPKSRTVPKRIRMARERVAEKQRQHEAGQACGTIAQTRKCGGWQAAIEAAARRVKQARALDLKEGRQPQPTPLFS